MPLDAVRDIPAEAAPRQSIDAATVKLQVASRLKSPIYDTRSITSSGERLNRPNAW